MSQNLLFIIIICSLEIFLILCGWRGVRAHEIELIYEILQNDIKFIYFRTISEFGSSTSTQHCILFE